MMISDDTASERTWAIPAISALIVLHHDFPVPRLAQIRRLVWSDNGLNLTLQYGTRTISGKIIDATDFLVTLHRNGAIGIGIEKMQESIPKAAMLRFLAGEIVRETMRWSKDLAPWASANKTFPRERAEVLNIVGALIGYPVDIFDIAVEKPSNHRTHVSRVRIIGEAAMMEITSTGLRSANLYVQPMTSQSMIARSYKKYDVPVPVRHKWHRSMHAKLFDQVSGSTIRIALLPMDFIIHLCDKTRTRPARTDTFVASIKSIPIVDAEAGDNLSALFS